MKARKKSQEYARNEQTSGTSALHRFLLFYIYSYSLAKTSRVGRVYFFMEDCVPALSLHYYIS
jgi:hypothetical protein